MTYDWRKYCEEQHIPDALAKEELIDGEYYLGRCRNATIARWVAEQNAFFHWRTKFGRTFVECIRHPADEERYDVFIPIRLATEQDMALLEKEIPDAN